ncbi:hypothetical protein J5N97_016607 [Dioscorea zingiberensis]|uniref:BEACH domain-containing protein B n=1 Tax=Dioscorea zingiberensis TaxID=325984 RepID=A0A9D5HFT9_9LILI|nr:hypothetical protein J5N97_016607 [Dioscorea zingiberensis]
MNIVKGVADLIRRSSGGQSGESSSWPHAENLSAPYPRIRFGEVGEEAVLGMLWHRYENALDKVEKKKLLQVFLLHFIQMHKNWKPVDKDLIPAQQASESEDVVVGCSLGHPSEVILILVQELARITSLLTELGSSAEPVNVGLSEPSMNLAFTAEELYALDCLTIITRSIHNCRAFGYYGGVQKVTALMKAAVIQLKTLTYAPAVDEQLSSSSLEKTRILQKILLYAVSIISTFMDFHRVTQSTQYSDISEQTILKENMLEVHPSNQFGPASEARLQWQRKAAVLVMETGGVNWIVELLRVIRRLILKEQWTDLSLQYLSLDTLRCALSGNPRAQNHFRSIGGLDVLLDGLGLPSSKYSVSKDAFLSGEERARSHIFGIFKLQILSLEVLRESTFGNLNNLQYLCENGRIHKLANSICWPAFMFQEFQQQRINSFSLDSQFVNLNSSEEASGRILSAEFLVVDQTENFDLQWKDYAINLSNTLCSFLLNSEDIKSQQNRGTVGQNLLSVSLAYRELSIRWFMKVLLIVFPCIIACSNESELPGHIRILANTLQHFILFAFRKLLGFAPLLLEVFREEGVWDLIFSEKLFYFGPSMEEVALEIARHSEGVMINSELASSLEDSMNQAKANEVDILQVEAVSFLEFGATLGGNKNNLPEWSVLLETLEQSACNPDIASILLRSMQRILQLAFNESFASFKSLDAVARILKVACIQAEELKKFKSSTPHLDDLNLELTDSTGMVHSVEDVNKWVSCMEYCLELFIKYFSSTDDAKRVILHNTTCIDCLFDLYWEDKLRDSIMEHILELLKLPPLSADDQTAKLWLCSKYMETFTRAKEREADFAEVAIDLLSRMRQVLLIDRLYYQKLFCDGECFLHIISLLNGTIDDRNGELLLLNVLGIMVLLLAGNNESKVSLRALVGAGYQTLQSLLLDFCKSQFSEELLNALLDMLVDGKFDVKDTAIIKNEDVILLFFNILQKSSASLQHYGLDVLLKLLKDSISNRTSCSRAGILSCLLDWFATEDNDDMISKIAQLIQVIGGHSISGKDIRKIFALLRSEKIRCSQSYCSLLLSTVSYMLKEKGPEAFFEFSGYDSGIVIKTPVQWSCSKGFSFTCWLRVEGFPETGMMGLFHFLTDNGRGCLAMLGKEKIYFESINQKLQSVSLPISILPNRWHFLTITHNIGRAFSGGSTLKCYIDGNLVSSEKCRYAKISEVLTHCTIGTNCRSNGAESQYPAEWAHPFHGQIGPIYIFNDSLSSEQIKGIYCLGPSYMYSFFCDEVHLALDITFSNGILDAKDGISSKILFGLNAQASKGRALFNVTTILDNSSEADYIVATVMNGTQLCSRRLLQDIIYCVGGAFVFFPLLTHFDRSESDKAENEYSLMKIMSDKLPAQVIELIASFLDGNLANQQHMHHHSGFSILGFLFETIPSKYLNMQTLSSLKYLFDVLRNCGMSELLLKDAILRIYLNPHIWVYANYEVQRDLYMHLIHYFENGRNLSPSLLAFPWIIDTICQFYCGETSCLGSKSHLLSIARELTGERPSPEEVQKIRLLLLSLGEASLRQKISAPDIIALIAFFERTQDMVCVEDVLHMLIRALSQKTLLAPFLEQVNLFGGCYVFINLLERELEPIRLLGLQLMGKLLVGLPPEKKGTKFFNLSIGRSKSISENQRKGGNMKQQTIFAAMSDRLFKFPLSDHLCATLFDVLLGGASPKQVLQKCSQSEKEKDNKILSPGNASHFILPQVLPCIFKFLASCNDLTARERIFKDLFDLLDSNPLNIECLMEYGWNSWLETSVKLYKNYGLASDSHLQSSTVHELALMRNLFCVVLSHYILSVKGGWHRLEETFYFLLLNFEQVEPIYPNLLLNIFEDLVGSMVEVSSEENLFASQPSRDNTLYLLKLIDEMLIVEIGEKILFPGIGISSSIASNSVQSDIQKDINSALTEILNTEVDDQALRVAWNPNSIRREDYMVADEYWVFCDKIWVLIGDLNGKGAGKMLPKSTPLGPPSFGQRARGLVESLNIPAAEMAAVVVSGGLGNALGGKANKYVDKAIPLRGEKYPRIIFHLLVLYLCKADLGRASKCVQQLIALLPSLFISDDDQSKNKLHFFIWSLLTIRSQHGMQDDGARFHIISHLLLETINSAKALLATSMLFREDSYEASSSMKEAANIMNLIQKDRVLAAAVDEVKYAKTMQTDCLKQLKELRVKFDEYSRAELNERKGFEDEMQADLSAIRSSDNNRRASSQLAHDEEQQIVSAKWIHMSRALSDERGPWSSNSFPSGTVTHWKLDKTEDRWRRRPKLKRNYRFNQLLCHPPSMKSVSDTSHPASECLISSQDPDKMKRFILKGVRGITEESNPDSCEDSSDSVTLNESHLDTTSENQVLKPLEDCSNQVDFVPDGKNLSQTTADSQSTEVQFSIPCVLVTPKRKLAGYLSLMQNVLHFFGEFLVEGTGGASVFKNFDGLRTSDSNKRDLVGGISKHKQPGGAENINANAVSENQPSKIKWHRRWNVSKIKAVHLTRYLLQFTAIEIHYSDLAHPVFFNFASQNDATHVGTVIVSLRNESLFPRGGPKDKTGVISFVDRRTAVDMAETSRECWRRREISNFEYLMILNTLAGRSYNDLTQYPVFPWVLADYSSEKLDFNLSSTFRDLSKPVGALDQKRFQVFEDRYRNFSDPDIPSFYYGSHYSSMGIVLFYLLRLEPFTTLHRSLQGGKFDHADRLFHSIEGTYRNCLSNTSDVKELIPEFFYMSEFLVNSNLYHLGVKQDGEHLDDVILPPWAKGSPEEFIYRNREALESEYVSSNLHHWIDLVFGYKQRGKPAVEAANVFYYLTYEGAVDLETMDDFLQRSAIEDQIANFGQTPIQIFRKKHPRRGPPIPIAHPLYFAPASITLTSVVSNTSYPPSAVLFVCIVDSNVVIVNQGLILSVKTWLTTQLQSGGNFTFSGSQDPFFGIGSDVLPPRKVGTPLAENFELRRQCLATMHTSGESYLISCGNWENSFQIISLNDGRIVQNIHQHKDVVSCVAVTSDGSILATGSYDTTVMIWHALQGRLLEKRSRNTQTDFPRKDQVILQAPVHILCGHDDIITCLFISIELDIVISGSKDGTCIFHTLREGRYIRSIKHPSGCALSKLVGSQHGRLVFYSENDLGLHMYSINGKHIASSESNGRLNCLELSSCGDFLVCASDHGHIVLRSMHSLDIIRSQKHLQFDISWNHTLASQFGTGYLRRKPFAMMLKVQLDLKEVDIAIEYQLLQGRQQQQQQFMPSQ